MGVEDSLISGGGASTPTPTPEQVPSNADASAAESGTENGNQVNQIKEANPANQANPIKQGFNFAKKSIKKAKTGIYKAKRDIKNIEKFLDDPTSLIKNKISNKIDDKFGKFDLEKYNPERVLDPENAAENLKQIKQKAEAKIAEKKKLAQDAAIVAAKAYTGDIPGAIMTVLKSEELKKQMKKEILKKLLPVLIGILILGMLILGIYSLASAVLTAIAEEQANAATANGMTGTSAASWQQFLRFVELNEGGSKTADGQYYYVEGDYGQTEGNPTIGHGLCLYSVREGQYLHVDEFAAHNIDSKALANAWLENPSRTDLTVSVEICDQIWKEHIRGLFEEVSTRYSSLNLKIYQLYALTDVNYRRGNTDGFATRYGQLWHESDDRYGEDTSSEEYSMSTLYAFFHNNTTETGGVLSRKKRQWLLFKYGWFDIINEYCNLTSGISLAYDSFDGFVFIGDSITVDLASRFSASVSNQSGFETVRGRTNTSDTYFKDAQFYATQSKAADYWNLNLNKLPTNATAVCVLLGVNNITGTNDMNTFIDNLVTRYGEETPIYIQKVFPVGESYTYIENMNSRIRSYNLAVENYCQKYDNIEFIDTSSGLANSSGYLKSEYTSDGLHLNSAGQDIWIKNMKEKIRRRISGEAGTEGSIIVENTQIPTYTSNAGITYIMYDQTNGPWSSKTYGNSTVARVGCPTTAAATALSGLGFTNCTPNTFLQNSYYPPTVGVCNAMNQYLGDNGSIYRAEEIRNVNKSDIIRLLQNGLPIVVHVNGGMFTSSEHYMTILDYDSSEDKFYVCVGARTSTRWNGWHNSRNVMEYLNWYYRFYTR